MLAQVLVRCWLGGGANLAPVFKGLPMGMETGPAECPITATRSGVTGGWGSLKVSHDEILTVTLEPPGTRSPLCRPPLDVWLARPDPWSQCFMNAS
jgi:hypothetical protein